MDIKFIVQAREGSSRFKEKWKADINGNFAVDYIIKAVRNSKYYNDNLIFLIPEQDKNLIDYIRILRYEIVHDKDRNVYQGFIDCGGDIQVRLTADSPCIDTEEIDLNIDKVIEGYDYASNEITMFGNCCEAYTFKALDENKPSQEGDKEHVTLALRRNCANKWLPSLMIDFPESLDIVRKWLND
jgi:spore coat polysaccharide biosynthesis protein SpsF (cytidylyltransferase family)